MSNRIRPGNIGNEAAMVRALKEKGFYGSGYARSYQAEEPRRLTQEEFDRAVYLASMTPEEFDALCAEKTGGVR